MFAPVPEKRRRCRVLYISPIKALAVDVERTSARRSWELLKPRNGRAWRFQPVWRCARVTLRRRSGQDFARAGRHSDHDARVALSAAHVERARIAAFGGNGDRRDSRARADEARHASGAVCGAPGRLCGRKLQRIALSATQRPLEEVARYLGGAEVERAADEAGRCGCGPAVRRKPRRR